MHCINFLEFFTALSSVNSAVLDEDVVFPTLVYFFLFSEMKLVVQKCVCDRSSRSLND